MDLAVEGRHALLFDDDANAAFVNSRDALVPWSGDPALLIDRYDARHLLDRIPPRPPRRAATRLSEELDAGGVTPSQLDQERYLDLPPPADDADAGGDDDVDNIRETLSEATKMSGDTYQAVPFSYGNTNNEADPKNSDAGLSYSGYRPPFPLPERLLSNLPPTEKLHQIIARTAMFVSQHGGQSEFVLRVKQGNNPTFGFLMPDHHLHDYFRFLVDHPQLLKNETTNAKAQEEEKSEERNDALLAGGGGALSLLGSFYGSAEDDDGSHQADSKVTGFGSSSIADIAAVPHRSEQAYKASEGKREIKNLATSIVSKEKTISIKKKLPVKSTLANALHSNSARVGNSILPGSVEQPRSSQSGISNVKPVLLEPPSFLKRMIDKIIEFITRNGKEFEAVLIEQDKTVGRFPFLLPSNQYHPYYLKVLEGARQGNAASKKKVQTDVTKESAHDHDSLDLSEGWLYDPRRKEKFKMVIGGSKKEKHDQQPSLATQSGVSADEAAAIVQAATRGVSPANAPQHVSLPESAAGCTHGAVLHASSIGSFSSLQGRDSISKPASSNEAGTSLRSSDQQQGKRGSTTVDDVWIAKAIAKTAALVASCEADSSEASLTKEQKLKAERLKRAKMFAAMIKAGDPSKMTSLVPAQNSSLDISAAGSPRSGTGSDIVAKEREGSSVPFVTDVSGRVKFRSRDSDHSHREKHHSSSGDLNDEDNSDGNHERSKKRHRSEHSVSHNSHDRKHWKSHSSSKDKESRHHRKHHSSSEDEYKHRKGCRSHHLHHRDKGTSEDEEERKRSDRHRRKHHSRSQRNHETERDANTTNLDQSEVSRKLSSPQREVNTPAGSDKQPDNVTTEVSSDLRAKVRAMLLETM